MHLLVGRGSSLHGKQAKQIILTFAQLLSFAQSIVLVAEALGNLAYLTCLIKTHIERRKRHERRTRRTRRTRTQDVTTDTYVKKK